LEPKRKLSEFDFSKKGAHISLVGPSLGGPANGRSVLTLKSLSPVGANNDPNGKGNVMSEMIEKSAADALILKAVEAATEPLKKELAVLKAAEMARTEAVRKSQLKAVVGDAKAEETFNALKSLDDASFEIIVKSYASANAAEGKSKMFAEKGVDGKADAEKVAADTLNNDTAKYLKSKYQKAA
jgi:hypothetical protein